MYSRYTQSRRPTGTGFSRKELEKLTSEQRQNIIERSMRSEAKNKQIINDTIEHHQNTTAKRTEKAKKFQKWLKTHHKPVTEQEKINAKIFNEKYDKKMEELQDKKKFILFIITKVEDCKNYDNLKYKLNNDIDIIVYNDESPESLPSKILTFLRKTHNLPQIKEKINNVLARINHAITELENAPNEHNPTHIKNLEQGFTLRGLGGTRIRRKPKKSKKSHRRRTARKIRRQ